VAVLLLGTAQAHAEPRLEQHDKIAAYLLNKYGERVIGRGLTNNGQLVELFATTGGNQSFSILITQCPPAPKPCVTRPLASGGAWDNYNIPERPKEPGA